MMMLLVIPLIFHVAFIFAAQMKSAEPTEEWVKNCKDIMMAENVFHNFSMAVAHGTHSISLQDIRKFFEKDARVMNRIHTVNRDLKADDEDIVTSNAPDIPRDFNSLAMHTFDVALTHMDDKDYIQKSGVLQRLSHHFHMHEIWGRAKVFYEEFAKNGVPERLCSCALNHIDNGIDQELTNIFLYFRDNFNKPKPKRGRKIAAAPIKDQAGGRCRWFGYGYRFNYRRCRHHLNKKRSQREAMQRNPLPKLDSSDAWKVWKEMIMKSMPSDEDVRKFALYMYCALM